MPLTATRSRAAFLLGVSDDTIDSYLQQGLLRRTRGDRFIHVTLESIAKQSHLPLDLVVQECRLAPQESKRQLDTAEKRPPVTRELPTQSVPHEADTKRGMTPLDPAPESPGGAR